MATFNDPQADASEAAEAVRGLAHAAQHVEDPDVLYPVIGDLMSSTRSLSQVLYQLATAHHRHTGQAATDNGDLAAGAVNAHEAAAALTEAAALIEQADSVLDRASNRSGRIAWQPTRPQHRWANVAFLQGAEADPVLEIIDRQGTDAAIEYLAGFDHGDDSIQDALENGYIYDSPPQTPADQVATGDRYALTFSPDLGYVGLSRQIPAPTDDAGLDTPLPEQPRGRHHGHERQQQREGSWFMPDVISEVAEQRGLSR